MFKRYVYIEGLTSLLGSNGKFLINNDGQVKDVKGNDIPYRRDDAGNRVVHCLGWDGEREYRVIDLVAIQFKSLRIPREDYGKVIAFTIDGNADNTHARNVGYRFDGGKLECKHIPGFYYVPGFTSIVINSSGVIFSESNRKERKFCIVKPVEKNNSRGGYRILSVGLGEIGQVSISRHRAVMLTFKEYPDNVDSMTVNHIDGVPGHDDLDNLEWATRGENNLHAYKNDLKNQHHRVLVRNVITGEVAEYYSVSECARLLGYATDETIRQRLITSKFGQVFQDGTQIKYKNDSRDWIIPENPEEAVKLNQERRPVLVRNCLTLEVVRYASVSDAGKATRINSSSIAFRLDKDNRSPLFGYQFKHESDNREWKDFTVEEFKESLKPNSFKIDARNLLTGEERKFDSMREAKTVLGETTINTFLADGKQPLYETGWQVKHEQDIWEEVKDPEETIYKLKRNIMCRSEETGLVTIADSAFMLGEHLSLDPKAIRKAAYTRGNKIYHGYRFRLGVSSDPWPTETTA